MGLSSTGWMSFLSAKPTEKKHSKKLKNKIASHTITLNCLEVHLHYAMSE